MKAIFFNNPLGTKKLSVVLTEKTVKELVDSEVIPKGSKHVSVNVADPDNIDPDLKLKLMHVEKTHFDDYNNPREVLLDMEMVATSFVEILRNTRSVLFSELDNLQIRASIKGKQNVVEQIEADKQKLRDFTKKISLSSYCSTEDFRHIYPDIFAIDYTEKYEPIINS